jgi:putative transposase
LIRTFFSPISLKRKLTLDFIKKFEGQRFANDVIRFITPAQRHEGLEDNLLDNRKAVYEAARAKHPQRWSGSSRNWQKIQAVHLNPDKV